MTKLGWLKELESLDKKASPIPWEDEKELSVADRNFINTLRNSFPEITDLLKESENLLLHYLDGENGCVTPGKCDRSKSLMCWGCVLDETLDKFEEAQRIKEG